MGSPEIIVRTAGNEDALKQLGPYGIETLIMVDEEIRTTAYRVKVQAESSTSTSYHQIAEELYYVLAGEGVAILDGVEHELKVGVFLRLPPGTKHAFRAGPKGLEMLDIHAPGCRPDRDVYFVGGEVPSGFKSAAE
jgi:mannose-6-phosphate isomerase-like protein (cupin superfamily)